MKWPKAAQRSWYRDSIIWVFPKNRDTPKWMIYNGKTLLKWVFWGYHHLRKDPYNSMCFNNGQPWGVPSCCYRMDGPMSFARFARMDIKYLNIRLETNRETGRKQRMVGWIYLRDFPDFEDFPLSKRFWHGFG